MVVDIAKLREKPLPSHAHSSLHCFLGQTHCGIVILVAAASDALGQVVLQGLVVIVCGVVMWGVNRKVAGS